MIIRLLAPTDAPQVAKIHRQAIRKGFLSSLNPLFLELIYQIIPQSKNAFGYVGEIDGEICGFICIAKDTKIMYKEIIMKWGILLIFPLVRYLFNYSIMRKIVNNLFYYKKFPMIFPRAEILSVAVTTKAQGLGLGKKLMTAAVNDLKLQKIFQIKALTDEANVVSNAYYLKNGFLLAQRVSHHDHYLNVYVKSYD